jgi:hypothetical protein
LSGRAGVPHNAAPEINGRAFVQQTHRQRLAPPVLHRPLAGSGSTWSSFETLVLLVGGQLRPMDRELPLGETQPCVGRGQIGVVLSLVAVSVVSGVVHVWFLASTV